jgi:YaiO family outer membrane protein
VAAYSFDSFSEPYRRFWQVYKAGALHDFSWGKGTAALNIGNITSRNEITVRATELQAEVEAYPKISSKNYAYLAYAYSPGSYFPRHRAAAEVWQVLPHSWAVSAGLSYYYFDRNIFIAGTSAEKYAGKYWFSVKAFIYFKDKGPTTSAYLNIRRYFNDDDYLQISAGTGTAPDEPFDIQTDIMRLSATGFRVSYFKKLNNEITFRIGAGYSSEEYAEKLWRNRFEGNVGISYPIMKKNAR